MEPSRLRLCLSRATVQVFFSTLFITQQSLKERGGCISSVKRSWLLLFVVFLLEINGCALIIYANNKYDIMLITFSLLNVDGFVLQDRIGKYLKVTIPELLFNQCANCDMAQRERAGKLVSHIQQNFPSEWERAVKKFQASSVSISSVTRHFIIYYYQLHTSYQMTLSDN